LWHELAIKAAAGTPMHSTAEGFRDVNTRGYQDLSEGFVQIHAVQSSKMYFLLVVDRSSPEHGPYDVSRSPERLHP
jgi:hypothetical protein